MKSKLFPNSGGGMKPLFTLLTSVTIILAFSFLATASSCGNVGGGNNNNNSGGGGNNNGDGSGNRGNNPGVGGDGIDPRANEPYVGLLKITVRNHPTFEKNVQVIDENNLVRVKIKPKALWKPRGGTDVTKLANINANFSHSAGSSDDGIGVPENSAHIISIHYEGATGGVMLFGHGDKTTPASFSDSGLPAAATSFPGANANDGGYWILNGFANDTYVHANFMNKDVPTGIAITDPNRPPFAFSASTGDKATRPILLCEGDMNDLVEPGAPTIKTDGTFKNGQSMNCWFNSIGKHFSEDEVHQAWLGDTSTKKKFTISVLAIRTDGETVTPTDDTDETKKLGIPGTTFEDVTNKLIAGVKGEDFAAFLAHHQAEEKKQVALRRIQFEIVPQDAGAADGGFDYNDETEIMITNLAEGIAKMGPDTIITRNKKKVTMSQIYINADRFPEAAVLVDADAITDMPTKSAIDDKITKVFDLALKGAHGDGAPTTPGLVLLDEGSRSREAFTNFTTPNTNEAPATESVLFTVSPKADSGSPIFRPDALTFYSIFADKRKHSYFAALVADSIPHSFSYRAADKSQPILACRSAVSTISSDASTPDDDTTLAGGQVSSCFISARNLPFTGTEVAGFFDGAANTKKAFIISAVGVRTGVQGLRSILDEDTKGVAPTKFMDGLDYTDTTKMWDQGINKGFNRFTSKWIVVKLVRQAQFDSAK